MLNFIPNMPIDSIVGAQYNPRAITPEAMESLKVSLQRFGVVKPLIINAANNIIVAGHQRQKAAKAIGMTHLPCIKVNAPNAQDEIHFNLLHNSIETSKNNVHLDKFVVGKYSYCPAAQIHIENEPHSCNSIYWGHD